MKLDKEVLEQVNARKQAVKAGQIRQQMVVNELNLFVVGKLNALGLDTKVNEYELGKDGEILEVKKESVEVKKVEEEKIGEWRHICRDY